MKQLIIVGIDPGATLAYSILNLKAKIIKIRSTKQHTFSSIISEIINYGIPLITCCDKNPPPGFVEKFATKTGSKLIYPKQDLLVKEKDGLTKDIKAKNIHEKDSLASALFGFNEIRNLLRKINKNLKSEPTEIKNKVIELVIKQNMPISEALQIIKHEKAKLSVPQKSQGDFLGKPEEEKQDIIKIIEEKQITKTDYLNLYEKLEKANKDIQLLKFQNQNLQQQLIKTKKDYFHMLDKIKKSVSEKPGFLEFKQQKITASLKNQIQNLEKQINKLNDELKTSNKLLSETNNNILLKKLDNLGYNEYQKKNQILNIKSEDILLINDLNIISENTIKELKNKISIIIYNKATKKIIEKLPFTCISSENLKIQENKYFAIIKKSELEKEIKKQNILTRVIQEYQEERSL